MLPSREQLESAIRNAGYDFVFLEEFTRFEDLSDGISCQIKGNKTFVQMHQDTAEKVLQDYPSFKDSIGNADHAISFSWGADIAAAAAIAVLSIALIDCSKAVVIYADDEMLYTREMLVNAMPSYLLEL
jgi:hypothetical protein